MLAVKEDIKSVIFQRGITRFTTSLSGQLIEHVNETI